MLELNDCAFGGIRVREILGAEPDLETLKEMLETEIGLLIEQLDGMSADKLEQLKTLQKETSRLINSRPGAMALPQSKIRLYGEYSLRYLDVIDQRIKMC